MTASREKPKHPEETRQVSEADLKRADAALKRLLSSPPAPFTPKPTKARKKK